MCLQVSKIQLFLKFIYIGIIKKFFRGRGYGFVTDPSQEQTFKALISEQKKEEEK